VQQFFTRIGDISYNYNLKKPYEIMGALWDAPEEHAEALTCIMALPVATRRLVQKLDYEQTARNNISYLGLQFFIARLHTNISLEVIKSNTTDLYDAFMIAHAYKTTVKNKKERDSLLNSKMDAETRTKRLPKSKPSDKIFNKRKCFAQTMVRPINKGQTGAMAPMAAIPVTATTAMAVTNNSDPDPGLHANQTQHLG